MNIKTMKPIVVASLFDGMSCAQLALRERGIPVKTYFASEINKWAIAVTKKNFPQTKFIGDIRQVNGKDLGRVNLIVAGSPCQGFSFASNGRLNFNHPESRLFYEFVRILRECQEINPDLFFILENVRMKTVHKDHITNTLGISPILIDSAKLSAQRRLRLYWTNIPSVTQPIHTNQVLTDILEENTELPVYSNIYGGFKKPVQIHTEKSPTLITPGGGGHIPYVNKNTDKIYTQKIKQKVKVRKHNIDTANLVQFLRENKTKPTKEIAEYCDVPLTQAEHWFRQDNSFAIPQPEVWNKLKEILNITTDEWDKKITEFTEKDGKFEMRERITLPGGKNPTLRATDPNQIYADKKYKVDDRYYLSHKMAEYITKEPKNFNVGKRNKINPLVSPPLTRTMHKGHRAFQDPYISTQYQPFNKSNIRKLTPRECSRLQTVPDTYTSEGIDDKGNLVPISNTQQYQLLGNGMTILIIAHILSFMEGNPIPVSVKKQLKLL